MVNIRENTVLKFLFSFLRSLFMQILEHAIRQPMASFYEDCGDERVECQTD